MQEDQRHYEPTLTALREEFPDFGVRRGIDRMCCYATPPGGTSPQDDLKGEDPMDLRDQIIVWQRLRADADAKQSRTR